MFTLFSEVVGSFLETEEFFFFFSFFWQQQLGVSWHFLKTATYCSGGEQGSRRGRPTAASPRRSELEQEAGACPSFAGGRWGSRQGKAGGAGCTGPRGSGPAQLTARGTEEGFCVEPVSRLFLCFCFMSPHSWSRGPSGPCDRGAASEVCAPRENDGRAQLRALCVCVCACPGFNPCTRVGVRVCACVHLLRVCVRRPVSVSVHAHTCAHAPLCVCVCARVSRRALCPLCFLNTDDTDSSTVLRLSQSQRPSELSDFGTTLPRRKLRPRGPA